METIVAAMLTLLYIAGLIIFVIVLRAPRCPNDGEKMEYDDYGGFECPRCGRYEKNGDVRFEGRKIKSATYSEE